MNAFLIDMVEYIESGVRVVLSISIVFPVHMLILGAIIFWAGYRYAKDKYKDVK